MAFCSVYVQLLWFMLQIISVDTVLVHVEGPWQTLIARLPNNPKILEYLSTWPFLAMA
jgi:hypothetical protein